MSEAGFTRLPVARPTRNELYLLESGGVKYLAKAYVGADGTNRRAREAQLLTYWSSAGYKTPAVNDGIVLRIPGPYLVMQWVEAHSLRDCLCDPNLPIAQRLQMSRRVLDVTSRRHAQAIASSDFRLIRDDANTGNFLIPSSEVIHIDLERLPRSGDIIDASAIELAKLLRWIVRDLGRDELDGALQLAVDAYRNQQNVLERIISRTCDRPGQFFHRLLDRRRKAHPTTITKYDVADGLQRLLA